MKTEKRIIESRIQDAEETVNFLKPTDIKSWERYREAYEPALHYSLMTDFPDAGDVQAFAILPSQQPTHRLIRFSLSRQGNGDRLPAAFWIPGGRTPVRQAVLLVHPAGNRNFEQEGLPGKFLDVLLRQGCSVLIPEVFNSGQATFQRTEERRFFTTYKRTDDAKRVQDILTILAHLRGRVGALPIKVVGFESDGLWCLLARGLAEDDAAFAVDVTQCDASSDEACLKTLNIPGIRRAGVVRTAAVLNRSGLLWIHNAGNRFPSGWIQTVYKSLGKDSLLKIEAQRSGEDGLSAWFLQGFPRSK